MSFNQFTNLDFNDLRTQIKDYLRANTDFSDFDFEGSNFSILIDVLAYNSYITAYNTNMQANESFIDSATLRENVVSLARNIGYVPRSKRSAESKISFTVNTGSLNSRTVTLKAGIVALGAVESGNYIFSIPSAITTTVDNFGIAYFNDISIYEGTYLTKTFTIDYSQPNQKYILDNTDIDTSTIRVSVSLTSTEKYSLYDNILNIDKNSKVFLIQEVNDEKYQILFGDNLLGKKPENGSTVLVSYIVTNGKTANGASNFTFSGSIVDNNAITITSGISLLTTTTSAQNGDDIEELDSIKYLAPRVYASQYRAVTANDYKALIPYIYTNVDSVSAYGGDELDPPQYGKVFISIKPRNGNFLSEIKKNEIRKKLKQYSIAGIKPEIIDLKYLYVELDTTIYYNQSFTANASLLRNQVINTLNIYSRSTDVNSFGGRFKYSKVNSLIDNTNRAITSNITKVKMRRDLQPAFNTFATYEICFGNKFHQKTNNYSIKSSGFKTNEFAETLYITDFPISLSSGRIILFKLIDNNPVIVKNNAGTVDYTKGEIILDIINITSTSLETGVIQIEASPESNDIIALKDIYLQIDISNTVVNTIEDVIESGENTSATQYTSTSSYLNGLYTR
jgi:hypothetical protein